MYAAASANIAREAFNAHTNATDGDRVRYSMLYERAPAAYLEALRGRANAVPDPFRAAIVPSVLSFDRLNKLQFVKADISISAMMAAAEIYEILRDNAERYAREALEFWITYFDAYDRPVDDSVVKSVMSNTEYPMLDSVINDAKKIADVAFRRVSMDIVRAYNVQRSVNEVQDYVSRREKATSEATMYTNDTLITVQSLTYTVRPYVTHFRSVTVEDEYVCDKCRDIEAAQAADPVPIDKMTRLNSPPFHPYCRCGVEFIWKEIDT